MQTNYFFRTWGSFLKCLSALFFYDFI
jgi:hypothetical protein